MRFHMTGLALSNQAKAQFIFMLLLSTLMFGVIGFVLISLMQFVSMQSFAEETVHKHGIAEMQSSRLGGAATILGGIFVLYALELTGRQASGHGPLHIDWFAWIPVIGCMMLGLVEDIRNQSLSPAFRLLIKICLFGFVLLQWPELIPNSVGVPILDQLLSIPVLAFILTLIFCVGFLNAVNMADGANGLVSGIAVLSFTIFVNEFDGHGFVAVLISCSVFLIFNVISGRLFLGDAGAYGVGASLLITALVLYAEDMTSLFFLAALLSYPCIDFLVSIVRRLIKGMPVTQPDNDHLHNRIHFQFRKIFKSKNMANSASGLLIAAASSGTVLCGYYANWWPVTSEQWGWVFLIQCLLYFVTYYLINKTPVQAQTAKA